jgi:hypothetical protein
MSKKPPELFNLDAERSVIGAVLLAGPDVLNYPNVKELEAIDFWDQKHQCVWLMLNKIVKAGTIPDPLTVADHMRKAGNSDIDADYLQRLVFDTPNYALANEHAVIVKDWSRQRLAEATITNLGASFGANGRFDRALDEAVDELTELKMARGGPVSYCSMEQIRDYFGDVAWAWDQWLPIGHLSLIAGPQACGKSYLAAWLAAVVTGHIDHWPDGTLYEGLPPEGNPKKILLVETEEMRGVYAERLERLGVGSHWIVFGPGDETYIPDLLKDADRIEQLAHQEDVGAVIVDSLSGGHELKEEGAEMRRLLKRYAAMVSRLQSSIMTLVHHTRKRGSLEPIDVTLDRVRGSSTITQFCRSVIALYRLEENDTVAPVRMQAIKSTFCAPPDPLGFVITDRGLVFVDAPEPVQEESQQGKAADILRALLKDGPVWVEELKEEADGAGISWKTFKRAKQKLGIVSKRQEVETSDGRQTHQWTWGLPAFEYTEEG